MSEKFEQLPVDELSNKGARSSSRVETDLVASQEKLRDYLMVAYKKGILPIVKELKDDIEKGTYDTLISDDAGARLPTLILKDVFKAKGPEDKEMKALFLALGRRLGEGEYSPELEEYVREHKDEWGKALLVTEYVGTGETLSRIRAMFDGLGLHFDEAVLYSNYKLNSTNTRRTVVGIVGTNSEIDARDLSVDSKEFSGVTRHKHPFPIRTDKLPYKKLTENDKIILQRKMNQARIATKQTAQEIITEIWGK